MVFSTVIFLCAFLPITIIIYYLMPKALKNYFLLFASLLFYAWGEPKYLLIMLFTIAVNYAGGLLIASDYVNQDDEADEDARVKSDKKAWLVITIILNLAVLCFFKYTGFMAQNIRRVFPGALSSLPDIALPIGISFYTFQGLSYAIDVYRDRSLVQKNPFKLALYISMFPQLIAGPIVRYTSVRNALDKRKHTPKNFALGMERFIVGLFKKAVLANNVGALADQVMKGDFSTMGASVAWLGAIAYTLQIFYDFAGYSDMAIGLGLIFGFHFPENFNKPYISKSISEFWRRWHMSLSSWFKDYVYIPLGGSRSGNVYINLMIVFILTGIWHGAGWGFLLWGLWHGSFVVAERFVFKNRGKDKNEKDNIIITSVRYLYTMTAVIVGWVLFRLVSVRATLSYLKVMFFAVKPAFKAYDVTYYLSGERIVILIIAIIFCFVKKPEVKGNGATRILYRALLILMLIASYIYVITGSYNPFIYFRF